MIRYICPLLAAIALLASFDDGGAWKHPLRSAQASPGVVVDGAMDGPTGTWVWTPSNVYLNLITGSTAEIKASDGSSLSGVLGLEVTPAVGASPAQVLIWNGAHIYRHLPATTSTVEVTKPDGTAIGGIQGVAQHLTGSSMLIWTATQVFLLTQNHTTAEVTLPGGVSIPGVQGAAAGTAGTYVWNAGHVYLVRQGPKAVELVTPAGAAIASVAGIVVTQPRAYLWTSGNVFVHSRNLTRVAEIHDPSGASVAGVQGIVAAEPSFVPPFFPDTDQVFFWNATHVYHKRSPLSGTEELITPSGGSIAGVRAIVGPLPMSSLGGAVVWNATNAYRAFGGSPRTAELTTPAGGSLAGIQGAVTGIALHGSSLLMWNAVAVYRLGIAYAEGVQQVTDVAGSAIGGVRGVVGGHAPMAWTSTKVYAVGSSGKAAEIKRPDGSSLGGAWGVLSTGIVRTSGGVFAVQAAGPAEIRAPNGTSIASSASPVFAVVDNAGLASGAIGIGAVNTPSPYAVGFVEGTAASQSIVAGTPPGVTTITGQGPGYQTIASASVTTNTSAERPFMLQVASPTCTPAVDPDCNGDVDFSNPGAGMPCVQDHKGDANGDGYSDADELTPVGSPSCTGAFPPSGGLGLSGLSSTSISAPCAGRPPGSAGAMKAKADVDLDGAISIIDLSIVAGYFLQSANSTDATDIRWEFDQDGDGMITIIDLSIMAGLFLQSVPPC